jgi:protein gp37
VNKTRIEWCRSADGAPGYTSNPVKGYCPMVCSYCYARAMYDRFKWDKVIRFVPEELAEWSKAKAGDKIFVGSTIELFGEWVPDYWMRLILDHVAMYPDVIFIFLTKCPWNLPKWNPWPDNAWVGMTATDVDTFHYNLIHLLRTDAIVKFCSFEPLLDFQCELHSLHLLQWVIIGAQTNPYKPPKREWVEEIIAAANKVSIPIFLKDNLFRAYPDLPRRQEFPERGR